LQVLGLLGGETGKIALHLLLAVRQPPPDCRVAATGQPEWQIWVWRPGDAHLATALEQLRRSVKLLQIS
jgi:hypothetical protein